MDLVLGGAIEIATPAVKKFAKDLSERLGRAVTDEEAFDILQEKKKEYIATNKDISEEEREKLLRELAEESNRRKEKPDTWKPVEEHIEEIRKMEPAAIIEHPQFNMGEGLIEKVADYFSAIGNKVRRDDIGDVLISRRGIKDSFAHGMTEEKAKAFEAVPEVIRKGKIIGEQQNWKGRGYDTALIVGSARIENAAKPIGVIIKRDKKSNRYYMHEVLDLDEIKTGKEFSPGPSVDGLPGSQPVVNSNIADSVQNVNTPQAKSGRKKQKALKEMNKAEQFYAANVDNLYGAGRVNAGVKESYEAQEFTDMKENQR
jgi:hypothetical protein